MARPWRLRHKLVLGLLLVVGSVALLLGGALFGLSSYVDTMRTTQRKLDEMQIVVQLRDHIHRMAEGSSAPAEDPDKTSYDREREQILEAIRAGRLNLTVYRELLKNDQVRRDLDPDGGESELALADRIEAEFTKLEDAVAAASAAGVDSQPGRRLMEQAGVKSEYQALDKNATALFQYIVSDVKFSFERSNANHRRSLSIAGFAAILAVVLILTLMYYFRVWVFSPIRAIQAGVTRVRDGNFAEPIRLESQDELQELADEFNAMAARMQAIHADLARQVDERSRQLVEAEKMVSVGFLAAGVAHEINNPLASIAFCAEALERRLQFVLQSPGPDNEVIAKYLTMIQQESFRCKQITERLLDYSRSGNGRWETTDLNVLVQNVLDLVQHLPSSRGKQIQFRPEGRVTSAVHANEMQGLVNNLVVNALENMDEGGKVLIALRTAGENVELQVKDTGCGMTAAVLSKIFEPFYTQSKTGKGTGLGLFISQRVATQHGGTITATSDGPGKGSTFTVRFPRRTEANVPASDSGPQPTTLPFQRKTAA